MGFMEMLERNQKQYTENGAIGYKTTGHKLLDLNFKIPSFRNSGIDKDLFEESLNQDERLTLKWLLYLRDIHQGVGERKSFREFVKHLIEYKPQLAHKFLSIVPIEEYGRWDDYVDIYCFSHFDIVADMILDQWKLDCKNMEEGKPISLLVKWAPSENASSKKTKEQAWEIRTLLGLSSKEYRKSLSKMRKYLDIVERKMSANDWKNIDYNKVPSRANLIYMNSFFRHDKERRCEYLASLKNGESKINAQDLFLHDIVHKYKDDSWDFVTDYNETLEQLWKAQNKVEGFSNTLVVRDGSGSMYACLGRTNIRALDIADAITLYCAENNQGEFKDKFITFGRHAEIIDLSTKKTLRDKLIKLSKLDDYSTTNIEGVFNLILNTALENHISNNELPKNILIISD